MRRHFISGPVWQFGNAESEDHDHSGIVRIAPHRYL